MGLIFPWTYLWAPGALPGGQIVWGILLAIVLEIPIALAYVWLSTALPEIRRRLRLPEPRARRRDRLHAGHVRVRDLDPPVGRAVRVAAQLPRLCAALPGSRRDARERDVPRLGGLVRDRDGHRRRSSIINAFVALVDPDQSGFKNYVRLQQVMWVSRPDRLRDDARRARHDGRGSDVEGQINAFSTAIGGSATFYGGGGRRGRRGRRTASTRRSACWPPC